MECWKYMFWIRLGKFADGSRIGSWGGLMEREKLRMSTFDLRG